MSGEISPLSGIFNGVFIHKFSDNINGRVNLNFAQERWNASQICFDVQNKKNSLSIIFDKMNPFAPKGLLCAQYLHEFTKNFFGGFDLQTFAGNQVSQETG